MKYKFKITKDGVESEEKEAMSYKKLLKSLVTGEPKWGGTIKYLNKKRRVITHTIKNGKKVPLSEEGQQSSSGNKR